MTRHSTLPKQDPKPAALVIGAGIGGLATAALLAKDGFAVTVLEKNDYLGGRMALLKKKGFTFDMGPSWYLMPEVFETFFQEFGHTTNDFLKLRRLSPQHRIFFNDGTFVEVTGDLKKDCALFESIEPGAGEQLLRYLAASKEKYETAMQHFLYRNMDSVFDFFNLDFLKKGRELSVFESMDSYVKKFFKSEKLQQIIEYTLVFLGGSPKNTPALYSLMSHIDFNLGVWYPEGGIYSIVQAMVKLGKEYGVTYVTDAAADEIIVKPANNGKGVVQSVRAGKKTYSADVVISNADYAHTESLLSEEKYVEYGEKYWQQRTLAPSAFLLYLGIKGKIPQLTHHNLFFGENWMEHFDEIFNHPDWPVTPSVYLNKTTHADSTVAPKGHETLFILVPIASGLTETEELRSQYAEFIIKYLDTHMGLQLEKRIVFKEIFSVGDFAAKFNSQGGTALGLAHTLFQTSIWRPTNHSTQVQNLYYVGAGTVPGIGMPICLISAELVRQRIHKAAQR